MAYPPMYPQVTTLAIQPIRQEPINFTKELIDEENIVNFALTLDKNNYENLLKYLSDHYHNYTALISDEVYDELIDVFEAKYEPYTTVGADPSGEKVQLPHYLGSLRKIKKEQDLTRWVKNHPGPYLVQDKIDGITLLFYSTVVGDKRTTKIYTRGGGYRGLDVTHSLPYLSVPDWLKREDLEIPYLGKRDLSVRGELVMSKEAFSRMGKGFANARGMASGTMNAKTLNPEIYRELTFYAYRIIDSGVTPADEINTLIALGFNVPSPVTAPDLSVEILENYYKQRRQTAPYKMDGLVIYQNVIADYPVGEYPRHVVAFKTLGDTAVTTVKEVIWEGSKDRKLAPVIIYEPVIFDGVRLQRATGYNARFIVNNNIGPGAQIVVTHSGDTIPKVLATIVPSPTGPQLPTGNYAWNENQVEFVLLEDNDEVITSKLKYFLDTLDILGFGPERVKLLVKAGVKDIGTLVNLSPEQIAAIPGIGPILSSQLHNDLQGKIKNVALPVIMVASGLFPGIGLKRMEAIVEKYPNLLEYADIDPATVANYIRAIRGFNSLADDVAGKLRGFRDWLRGNPTITVKSVDPLVSGGDNSLQGFTVVFSGFRDKDLEQRIKNKGGKVSTSVSKNTSIVVMKDTNDVKGKAEKALNLGVPLINRDNFIGRYLS